jgi:outer membrane murein-binding lipoprotein Lpp
MPASNPIDNGFSMNNDVAIVDDMNEKIGFLGKDVSVLKTDVSDLKVDVAVLKTDVSDLKADVAVLKTDVAVLKTDVAVLKTDVSEIKADVSVLKTDVGVLKIDVAVIRSSSANYATKADIAMLEASMLKWVFGGFVSLAGIIVAAAKFIR